MSHDFVAISNHFVALKTELRRGTTLTKNATKGTIHPSLRLLPSGNFFLALNRSHHFLLKKSQNLIRQVEDNDSNLITLLYILSIFQQSKVVKFESLCSSCPIQF